MNWLEIIELRSVHIDSHFLKQEISLLIDQIENESVLKMYINVSIESDFRIHLLHRSEKIETRGSRFGIRIREMLKEFGLVNHSVWMER